VPTTFEQCGAPVVLTSLDRTVGPHAACSSLQYSFDVVFSADSTIDNSTAAFTTTDTAPPTLHDMPPSEAVECDAVPNTFPTAIDSCDSEPSVVLGETRQDGRCPNAFLLTRTFITTDGCGNSAQANHTLTVDDSTAPSWRTPPSNVTFECDGAGNTAKVQAWLAAHGGGVAIDTCQGAVVITHDFVGDEGLLGGDCSATGIISVTFNATDVCGNVATATATVAVRDTTPPALVGVPANATVECTSVPTQGPVVAADTCDPGANVTWREELELGECTGRYTLWRTWTGSDACGNEGSVTQALSVVDTRGPHLVVGASDAVFTCDNSDGELAAYLDTRGGATADDACGGEVTWSHDFDPPPASIADDCGDEGAKILVTFAARDPCGNPTVTTATATVRDSIAPALTGVPLDETVACDKVPTRFNITANDACTLTPDIALKEDKIPGTCHGHYQLLRSWTATDACGNANTREQTLTVFDDIPPALLPPPSNRTSECDGAGNKAALQAWLDTWGGGTATDTCGSPVNVSHNYAPAMHLQLGCAVTYTADSVEFRAVDDCGNSVTSFASFYATDTTPPLLEGAPASVTVECNALPSVANVSATDVCDAQVSVEFMEAIENVSPVCQHNYTLVRTWSSEDDCGQRAEHVQSVFVVDTTPPVITTHAEDVVVECQPGNTTVFDAWLANRGGAHAADACSHPDALRWWYDNDTELYDAVAGCGLNAVAIVTFFVTDECGNVATTTATYSTIDTTPPAVLLPASPRTVQCRAGRNQEALHEYLTEHGGAVVTDACSRELTWTHEISESMQCGMTVDTAITFTATDACGNTVVTTGNLAIVDTRPPIIELNGTQVAETEVGWPWTEPGLLSVSDECHGPLRINATTITGEPDVTTLGSYNITYAIRDQCGLNGTLHRTIQVVDRTPPSIMVHGPSFVLLRLGARVQDWGAEASDSFDGNVSAIATVDHDKLGSVAGRVPIFYEAEDRSGNRMRVLGRQVFVLPSTSSSTAAPQVALHCDSVLAAAPITPGFPPLPRGQRFYALLEPGLSASGATDALREALNDGATSRAFKSVRCWAMPALFGLCEVNADDAFGAVREAVANNRLVRQVVSGVINLVGYQSALVNIYGQELASVRADLPRLGYAIVGDMVCRGSYCFLNTPTPAHGLVSAKIAKPTPVSVFEFAVSRNLGKSAAAAEARIVERLVSKDIVPLYVHVADDVATVHILGAQSFAPRLRSLGFAATRTAVYTRLRVTITRLGSPATDDAGLSDETSTPGQPASTVSTEGSATSQGAATTSTGAETGNATAATVNGTSYSSSTTVGSMSNSTSTANTTSTTSATTTTPDSTTVAATTTTTTTLFPTLPPRELDVGAVHLMLLEQGLVPETLEVDGASITFVVHQPITGGQLLALQAEHNLGPANVVLGPQAPPVSVQPERSHAFTVLFNSTLDGGVAANLAANMLLREHIDAALGPHITCNGTDNNVTECTVTLEHRPLPADLEKLLAIPAVVSLGEVQDASFARDLKLALARELQRLFALPAERLGVTYTTEDEERRQRDVSVPVEQAVTLTVAVAAPPAHQLDVSTFTLEFALASRTVDGNATTGPSEASSANATTTADQTSATVAAASTASVSGNYTTPSPMTVNATDSTTAGDTAVSTPTNVTADATASVTASPTTHAPDALLASDIEVALAAAGITAASVEVDLNTSVVRALVHTTYTTASILQILDAMEVAVPGTVTLSKLGGGRRRHTSSQHATTTFPQTHYAIILSCFLLRCGHHPKLMKRRCSAPPT
jgi:hypothetical protein